MSKTGSPFLLAPTSDHVASNALAFAIRDRFPVSEGHTLVIPRRLVTTWFEASREEQLAILELVEAVKQQLDASPRKPDGYNVGFNAGVAAGQTVMHLHVHVIPRYSGDMDDPRGGVRHVIPSKGNYLKASSPAPFATGGETDPFARHVLPLFDTADEIAIIAAFVQESGLRRLEPAFMRAIERGARVRLLTGDYLDITQAGALERLLDWESATRSDGDTEDGPRGSIVSRVIETEKLPGRTRAFHPKAWRFETGAWGLAFVGSSNLSLSALETGIEWNLGIDRSREPATFERLRHAFDALWAEGRPLDPSWIAEYAARARASATPLPSGEQERDPVEPLPAPHDVQREALARLREARRNRRTRALVVFATGLGKTLLAVLDYAQLREETGRKARLLFVAHRREILLQASRHYRKLTRELDPGLRIGWCSDSTDDLDADLVFASVAKLARPAMLERLRSQRFDYVVIDEVHHATAGSYRKILGALNGGFVLGLTATPDRADSADVFGLFDDFVAHRAGIGEGIGLKRLVPFAYRGVKDDIDYANIPWRNRRFDPELLAQAAQTEARMATLYKAWQSHPGARTLVFCCSVAHAVFVKSWLVSRGVRAEAIFSGAGSDDREGALRKLEAGELDAVCAVDVFNEGVDIPSIDRVVMLRPTESSVVFLQQLGRGLRAHAGKSTLTVIDFVGNHRIFLDRLRTLLSLSAGADTLAALRGLLNTGSSALPDGCSVELQLEAKDVLSRMFRVPAADSVETAYEELKLVREARPTAGELYRHGHDPKHLTKKFGGWFEFVEQRGDLAEAHATAARAARSLLRMIEQTEMTKCFKMVFLEALLELDGVRPDGVPLDAVTSRSWEVISRSPELLAEVPEDVRPRGGDASDGRWRAYWRKNPVQAWTEAKKDRASEMALVDGVIRLNVDLAESLREPLAELLRELVDYRLARYRRRMEEPAAGEAFVCKVLRNARDPILKLPSRAGAGIPEGERDVRLPDGSIWSFRFAKEFINVARPVGAERNQLPDLTRRWFGPTAGMPGTSFQVRFTPSPDGLWIEPASAQVIAFPGRRNLVATYPDLRAAAGHAATAHQELARETVALPMDGSDEGVFAVRVAGDSMDGGKAPLRHGDWAVLRLARGVAPSEVANRVVLVESRAPDGSGQYQLKRLVKRDGRWTMESDNPDGPTIEARDDMSVIARLERAIAPESLAPEAGTTILAADLDRSFGVEGLKPKTERYAGHLFCFIDRRGLLASQSSVVMPDVTPKAAETVFVLAQRSPSEWRYLGVGRRAEDRPEVAFEIPEVDFETWRTFGVEGSVSRPLPDGCREVAQRVVDVILGRPEDERVLVGDDGGRGFVRRAAPRGGLVIDGSPGGFKSRTVSITDLAWVVAAARDAKANGGLLDEARVNRLRYLEGTPK